LALGDVGEFKVQMFSLIQMFNRIPILKFSTTPPFAKPMLVAVTFSPISIRSKVLKNYRMERIVTFLLQFYMGVV
jgi:hypothetical protein